MTTTDGSLVHIRTKTHTAHSHSNETTMSRNGKLHNAIRFSSHTCLFHQAEKIHNAVKITESDHGIESQRELISSFEFRRIHSIVLALVKLFHFPLIYCLFALASSSWSCLTIYNTSSGGIKRNGNTLCEFWSVFNVSAYVSWHQFDEAKETRKLERI